MSTDTTAAPAMFTAEHLELLAKCPQELPIIMAGIKRDPGWPKVRDEHLRYHPFCAVCRAREQLNVHHIKPFHLYPKFELEDSNLITLCEGSTNCHFLFGHLRDWKAFNPRVEADAKEWEKKIIHRSY